MANPDTPFGLRPALHLMGGGWNGSTMKCYTSSGEATAIFIGDPVDYVGDSCAKGCCPQVSAAAAVTTTEEILGVMVSADPFLVDTTDAGTDTGMHIADIGSSVLAPRIYRLAKEERFINCVVDPNVIYACQGDSATTSAITNCGANADLVQTHTGDTDTGLSGTEVDVSSISTTLRDSLFVWGMVNRADHNIGINDWYYVMLNTAVLASGTAGRCQGV